MKNTYFVDDYGDLWYYCKYTNIPTHCDLVLTHGAFIAGVKSLTYYAPTEEAKLKYKQSRTTFDENERNCNTCVAMQRVPHKKDKYGFLQIQCTSPYKKKSTLMYQQHGTVFWIHPDDPMNMPCYSHR